jgi:ferredoxin
MLVIDPDECIDCTLCVAECPVEAIFAEDDVPDDQRQYLEINAELAKVWKPIIEKIDGPPDADEWAKPDAKAGGPIQALSADARRVLRSRDLRLLVESSLRVTDP